MRPLRPALSRVFRGRPAVARPILPSAPPLAHPRFHEVKTTIPIFLALLSCGALGACAAEDPRSGFELPDVTVASYDLEGNEVASDWSCLGTPSEEVPTAVEVTVSGGVFALFSFDPVANIEVSGFAGTSWDTPFASDVSDEDGAYSLTVPAGTSDFGIRLTGEDQLTGFRLGVPLDPEVAEQQVDLDAVSISYADGMLSALLGLSRSPGTGLLLGGIRDCGDHGVAGTIVTVSQTEGEPVHARGVSSYYSDATGFPTVPNIQPYTNETGLFFVAEIPVASATNWLQVWGFLDEGDLEAGELTLLAEKPIPMVADSAISIGITPLRSE